MFHQLLVISTFLLAKAGGLSSGDDQDTSATSANIHPRMQPQGPISMTVFNIQRWLKGGAYFANLTVGTPGQDLTVALSLWTGSTLIQGEGAINCQNGSIVPCRGGTYNYKESATFKLLTECHGFSPSWESLGPCDNLGSPNLTDGHLVASEVSDMLQIGNVALNDIPFQLVSSNNGFYGWSELSPNILGLGYSIMEYDIPSNYYPSLIEALVASGTIESRVFSISLGLSERVGQSEVPGKLILGGINLDSISGPPITINFVPGPFSDGITESIELVQQPIISIPSLTVNSPTSNQSFLTYASQKNRSYTPILSYSDSLWQVPPEVYDLFISAYNASGVVSSDLTVPCNTNLTGDVSFSIDFGNGFLLNTSEFLNLLYNSSGYQLTDEHGNPLCSLALVPAVGNDQSPFLIMGTIITKLLYAIFDLDNGQVSISRNHGNGDYSDGKVVTVGKGKNAVHDALKSGGIFPPNTASIAGPAISASTRYRAVSVPAKSYDVYAPLLPLDAATMSNPGLLLSSGILSKTSATATPTTSTISSTTNSSHKSAAASQTEEIYIMSILTLVCVLCYAAVAF